MRLPAPRRSPPRLLKEAGRQRFPEMGSHLLPRKLRDIHSRVTEQGEGGDKIAKLLPRRMYRSGLPESKGVDKNKGNCSQGARPASLPSAAAALGKASAPDTQH